MALILTWIESLHQTRNRTAGYRRMIAASATGRVGTPDEIGATAAFIMGRDGSFISGADLLMDGGVMASIATGRYEFRLGGNG